MPARPWFPCFRKPRRPQAAAALPVGDPDRVMLQLSQRDPLTFREAGHVSITGSSGSGKSSTIATLLPLAHLINGHGGLVLAAKDDLPRFRAICRHAGREKDLVAVDDGDAHGFNFMEYCARTARSGVSMAVADVLDAVCDAVAPNRSSSGGGHSDPFWKQAQGRMTRSAVDILVAAGETLSIDKILRVVISVPSVPAERFDQEWQATSYCAQVCRQAAVSATTADAEGLKRTLDYLLIEVAALGDRTRSSIVEALAAGCDYLCRPPLNRMFGGRTTVTPEDAFRGRLLYIDLPTLHHHVAGRIAMSVWKLCFQQAVASRDPRGGVPVFLMADEAQEHVSRRDAAFLAIARESACSAIFVSQNRSNYDSVIGRDATDALLSNFQTHVFLANVGRTNEWASEMIARRRQSRTSISQGEKGQPGGQASKNSFSASLTTEHAWQLDPHAFTTLRTASPQNGGIADGVVFTGGRVWSNGLNHIRTTFPRVNLGL